MKVLRSNPSLRKGLTKTLPLNFALVPVIVGWLTFAAAAQQPKPAQTNAPNLNTETETIRINTALVTLNVGVYDQKGQQVETLTKEHFAVYEEGQQQELAFFGRVDQPISFGLLLDRSQSMGDTGKLAKAKAVLQTFLRAGNPQNEAFCLAFNETHGLVSDFTSDYTRLANTLDKLWAEGGTALYDAMKAGLEHLRNGKHQRRALIVVTDGGDQHSETKLATLLKLAQQSDAQIFTIGFFNPIETRMYQHNGERIQLINGQFVDNPRYVFIKLAKETGAETFFPQSVAELEKTVGQIAASLRRQYTLSYYPNQPGTNDAYRRITVKLVGPDSQRWQVKTRLGYRPTESTAAETNAAASAMQQVSPSDTPQPPSLPLAEEVAPALYRQNFTDPVIGWSQSDKAFAKKGKYYLRGQQLALAPPFRYTDFEATVTISFPAGAADSGQIYGARAGSVERAGTLPTAGLSFRINERGYYSVALAPGPDRQGGYFKLLKVVDGIQNELTSWRKEAVIREPSEIKVRCRGAQIEVFINQLRVAVVQDNSHHQGGFGFVTGDNEAVFDNLILKKIE